MFATRVLTWYRASRTNYRMKRNLRFATRRTALLLGALLFVLAETIAAAHAFDHALGHHEGACAVQALADHAGKALANTAPVLPPDLSAGIVAAGISLPAGLVSLPPYQGRAPPVVL
jgi:hypothetical protein